jgi:hypothetical protein
MNPQEFEARIIEWARRQSDIEALVQFGSRVLGEGKFDALSDWDLFLISKQPQQYYSSEWLSKIAPLWCVHTERPQQGGMKVSAVFENGLEADFVVLATWQMKIVYWGMGHPEWSKWMPSVLHSGILETQLTLLGSGYKVLVGGKLWEERLRALRVPWAARRMSAEDFSRNAATFWQKSVSITKKISRSELRSAMHWLHKLVLEHIYPLLEEETRLSGRTARTGARKAERWLDAGRLQQTAMETRSDQGVLARTLLAEMALFEDVCKSVTSIRGWKAPDYSAVATWLRQELNKLSEGAL